MCCVDNWSQHQNQESVRDQIKNQESPCQGPVKVKPEGRDPETVQYTPASGRGLLTDGTGFGEEPGLSAQTHNWHVVSEERATPSGPQWKTTAGLK